MNQPNQSNKTVNQVNQEDLTQNQGGKSLNELTQFLEEKSSLPKNDPNAPKVVGLDTSPSTRATQRTEAQTEELQDKGLDNWVFDQGNQDFNKVMLEKQSTTEAIGRAVGGGIYKGGLGVIENVGYLADAPDWFRMTEDFDNGVTNFLSDWASEKSQEYSEYNPIYTEEGSMDLGFWLNTFQSVVESSVEFGATGYGVGALMGKASKALRAKNILTSMLGEKTVTTMGTAFATNYVESRMMGAETYNNVYEQSMKNGMPHDEAKKLASEKALELIRYNKAMVVTDAISIGKSLNLANFTKGNAEKTIKQTLISGGIDVIGETGEESFGGVLSNELERSALLQSGGNLQEDQKGSFVGRTYDYMKTNEGLQEMMAGASGGPIQSLAMKPVKALIEKGQKEFYPEFKTPKVEKPIEVENPGEAPIDPETLKGKNFVTEHQFKEAEKKWNEYQEKKIKYDKFKVQEQNYENYLKEKDAYELGKKRHEELKNVGTIQKAKKDIDGIVKNDDKLQQDYKNALLNGDEVAAQDIQDKMFEGIFQRYASKGSTELLEQHLEDVIKNSQNQNEINSAKRFKSSLGQMQSEYGKLMNKHGVEGANLIFPFKARLDSSKKLLLNEAESKVNDSYNKLSKSIESNGEKDENGNLKNISITERAILEEMAKLEAIKDAKKNESLKSIELELNSKEKSIQITLNKLKEQQRELGEKENLKSKTNTEEFKNYVQAIKQKESLANSILVQEKFFNKLDFPEFSKKFRDEKFSFIQDEVQKSEDLNELDFLAKNVGSFNFDKKQIKKLKEIFDEKQKNITSKRKKEIKEFNKIVEENEKISKSIERKQKQSEERLKKTESFEKLLSNVFSSKEEITKALKDVSATNKNLEKFEKKNERLQNELNELVKEFDELVLNGENKKAFEILEKEKKLKKEIDARKKSETGLKLEQFNLLKKQAETSLEISKKRITEIAKEFNDLKNDDAFFKEQKNKINFYIEEIIKNENVLENIAAIESILEKEIESNYNLLAQDVEVINNYAKQHQKSYEKAIANEVYKREQERKLNEKSKIKLEDKFKDEDFLTEEIYNNAFLEKPLFEEKAIKGIVEKEKNGIKLSSFEKTFLSEYKRAFGIKDDVKNDSKNKKEEGKKEEGKKKNLSEILTKEEEDSLKSGFDTEGDKKKSEFTKEDEDLLKSGFDTKTSKSKTTKGIKTEDEKRPGDKRIELAGNETTDVNFEKENINNPILKIEGKEARNPKLVNFENSIAYVTKIHDKEANDSIEEAFEKGLIKKGSLFKIELETDLDINSLTSLNGIPLKIVLEEKTLNGEEVYGYLRDNSLVGDEIERMKGIRRGIFSKLKSGENVFVKVYETKSGVFINGNSLSPEEIKKVIDIDSISISIGDGFLIGKEGKQQTELKNAGIVYAKDIKNNRNVRMTLNKVKNNEAKLISELLLTISEFKEENDFTKPINLSNTKGLSPKTIIDLLVFEGGITMDKKNPFFISLKERVIYYGKNQLTFKEIKNNPNSLNDVEKYLKTLYKEVNLSMIGKKFKDFEVEDKFIFLGKEYDNSMDYNEFIIENENVTLNQKLNAHGGLFHQPLVFVELDTLFEEESKKTNSTDVTNSNNKKKEIVKNLGTDDKNLQINEELDETKTLSGKEVKSNTENTKSKKIELKEGEIKEKGSSLDLIDDKKYTNPREWVLSKVKKEHRDRVEKVLNKLSETQKQLSSDGDFYTLNKEGKKIKLERVSNVKKTIFKGKGDYSHTQKAGTTIDLLLRELINKEDVSFNDEFTDEKTQKTIKFSELFESEKLFNQYKSNFQNFFSSLEEGGFYPVIIRNGNDQNIRLYDEELGMAGEIDVLLVDENGNFIIADLKTSTYTWGELLNGKKYLNELAKPYIKNGVIVKEVSRNKVDDYSLQLGIYSVLLEKMTGEKSSNKVIYTQIDYDEEGIITDEINYGQYGPEGIFEVKSDSVSDFAPLSGKVEYYKKENELKINEEEVNNENESDKIKVSSISNFKFSEEITFGEFLDDYRTLNDEQLYNKYKKINDDFFNEINEIPGSDDESNFEKIIVDSVTKIKDLIMAGNYNIDEFGADFGNDDVDFDNFGLENDDDVSVDFGENLKTRKKIEGNNKDFEVDNDNSIFDSDYDAYQKEMRSNNDADAVDFSKLNQFEVDSIKERDLTEEMNWLQEVLPNVPSSIVKTLISAGEGQYAEGVFYKGMIKLSTFSKEGVAFHEGFHAVSQMFLSEKERKDLYNEYRKEVKDNTLTDKQVEELLAEEFRDYMIQHRIKERSESSLIKKLFNILKDLIKHFFGNKKSKLFNEIRKGRFKSGVVNKTEAKLFSKLNIKSQVYNDGVELTAYAIVLKSGLITEDNEVELDETKNSDIKEKVNNFIKSIGANRVQELEKAKESNDTEKVNILNRQISNLKSVVKNFDVFYESAKIRIKEMNLSTIDELDEDNDDRSSKELFAKSHVEYNGKDNATGHTKLLMSLLIDPTVRTESFGTPKMKNNAWEQIGNLLGNLTSYDEMKTRLEANKKMYPYIPELLKRLNQLEDKKDYYKIAQFAQAFSKQLITYVGHYYEGDDKKSVKIGNADNMSIGNDLRRNATASVFNEFYDSYGELKKKIKEINNDLKEKIKESERSLDYNNNLKSFNFEQIKKEEKEEKEIKNDKIVSYTSSLKHLLDANKFLIPQESNWRVNQIMKEKDISKEDAQKELALFKQKVADRMLSNISKELKGSRLKAIIDDDFSLIKNYVFYDKTTEQKLKKEGITKEQVELMASEFLVAYESAYEKEMIKSLEETHKAFSESVYGFKDISFQTSKAFYLNNSNNEFNPTLILDFFAKKSPAKAMNFTQTDNDKNFENDYKKMLNDDWSFIDSRVRSAQQLVNNIDYIFAKEDLSEKDKNSLATKLFKKVINSENSFINNVKETKEWFTFEGLYSDRPSDSMVTGPNNNKYSNKSEFNFMRSMVEEIRKGKGKEFYEDTIWGGHALNYDNENLNIEAFLLSKDTEIGSMDSGQNYSDLEGIDDVITRMNLMLEEGSNKKIIGLTPGDKSLWWLISGARFPQNNNSFSKIENSNKYEYNPSSFLHRYLFAEAERINYMIEKNKQSDRVDYQTMSKEGTKFMLFPSLNQYLNGKKENPYFKMTEEGLIDLQDLKNKSYTEKEQFVKNITLPIIQETYKYLDDLGLIEKSGDQVIGIKGVKNGGKNQKEVLEQIAYFVELGIYGNAEFSMLFTGDPAFYGKIELSKRVQATGAQGTQNADFSKIKDENLRVSEKFKVSIGRDIKKVNSLYEEYANFYKEKGEDLKTLDAYLKNNQTDGISYITPKRFRDLMIMQGQWSDDYEDAYRQFLETGETSLKLKEMQNLKGVHFELVKIGKELVPVYLKYSQMVLWGGYTEGTKLDTLKKLMESQGIDEYVTGIKVGIHNASSLEDVLDGKITELKTVELSNKHWRLQQDLRSKYSSDKKDDSTVASQAVKNITINVTTLDKNGKEKEFIDNGTGKKLKGKELVGMMHRIQSSISNDNTERLESKWGMKGSINSSKFRKRLAEGLAQKKMPIHIIEAVEQGAPLDSIFQVRNSLQTELRSTINKSNVKMKAYGGSFIQTPSAGLTGLQGIDMTKLNKIEKLSNDNAFKVTTKQNLYSKNRAIFFQDIKELKGPRFKTDENGNYVKDENGKKIIIGGEILIPFKYVELIPNWEKLSSEQLKEKLSDVLENVIGMRIPNQGLASIDALNVVGILPRSMGDTVMVYTGLTSKTGADFDIDKLFMLLPHAKYNKKTGKVEREKFTHDTDEDSVYERFEKKLEEFVKTHLKDEINKEIKEILSSSIKSNEKYIDFIEAKKEELNKIVSENKGNKKIIAKLKKQFNKLNEELNPENNKVNFEFIKETKLDVSESFKNELIEKGLFPNIEEFALLSIEDQNTLAAKENRRIELWKTVLSSEDMFADAVRPIDSVDLKNNAYHIAFLKDLQEGKIDTELFESIFGEKIENNILELTPHLIETIENYREQEDFYDFQLFDPMFQLKIKEQNIGAKIGVGQGANHLSHHPLAQTVELKMNANSGERSISLDLSQEYSKDGKKISDNINAYLNAYLDNAKDPYISSANVNKTTSNTVFLLIRAGFPIDVVNFFISQPIIRQVVFEKIKGNSTLNETEYQNFAKVKITEDEETGENKQELVSKNQPIDHFAKAWAKYNENNYNMEDLKVDFVQMLDNVNELKKQILNPTDEFQRRVLIAYMNLSERASKLNNLVKSNKIDTEGMGISFAEEIVKTALIERVKKSNAFENSDKLFEETFLKQYYENTFGYYNEFAGRRFLNGKQEFKDIVLETIEECNFDITEWESDKHIRKIENALYNYIYSKIPLFNDVTKEKRIELFRDLPEKIKEIQKNKTLSDNLFINELIVKFGEDGDPSFVTVNAKQREKDFIDNLTEGFEELYKMPIELYEIEENGNKIIYTTEDLVKDLVKASFFSSGFTSSLHSIHNLIATSFNENYGINEFIREKTNHGLNFSELEIKEFKRDFLLNNSDDKKIVKTFNSKSFKKVGESYYEGVYFNEENFTGKLDENGEPINNKIINIKIPSKSFGKTETLTMEYKKIEKVNNKSFLLFVPVETKGYYNKGYRVKEYGVSTIIAKNKLSRKIANKSIFTEKHFNTETYKQQRLTEVNPEYLKKSLDSLKSIDNFIDKKYENVEKIDDVISEVNKIIGFKMSDKQVPYRRFTIDSLMNSSALITTGTIINSNNSLIGEETLKGFNKFEMVAALKLGKPVYVFHKGTKEKEAGWYYWKGTEFNYLGKIIAPLDSFYVKNQESDTEITSAEISALKEIFEIDKTLRKEIGKNYNEMVGFKGYSNKNSESWNLIGEKMGFVDVTHFVENKNKLTLELVGKNAKFETFESKSNEEKLEANKNSSKAGVNLGILEEGKSFANVDYVTSFFEIEKADSVYIVGEFIEKGSKFTNNEDDKRVAKEKQVKGFDLAIRMELGIMMNKPVYVFNQKTEKWNTFNNSQGWKEIETPFLTENFAVYDNGNLTNSGKKAIEDVFKKTIESNKNKNKLINVKKEDVLIKETAKTLSKTENSKTLTNEEKAENSLKEGEVFLMNEIITDESIGEGNETNDSLAINKNLYTKNGITVKLSFTSFGKSIEIGDKKFILPSTQTKEDVVNFLEKVNFTKINSILEAVTNCAQ